MTARSKHVILATATTLAVAAITTVGVLVTDHYGQPHRCGTATKYPAPCGRPQTAGGDTQGEGATPPVTRPAPTRASRSRTQVAGVNAPKTLAKDGHDGATPFQRPAVPAPATSLNWTALAECESGNDPTAVSASGKYRGAFQFDLTTWANYGPAGDPAAAPYDEQLRRARALYAVRGRSPWPVCGRQL